MSAKILRFLPRPETEVTLPDGTLITAVEGLVWIAHPGCEPQAYPPEHAQVLGHALETVAWSAHAQREDQEHRVIRKPTEKTPLIRSRPEGKRRRRQNRDDAVPRTRGHDLLGATAAGAPLGCANGAERKGRRR